MPLARGTYIGWSVYLEDKGARSRLLWGIYSVTDSTMYKDDNYTLSLLKVIWT